MTARRRATADRDLFEFANSENEDLPADVAAGLARLERPPAPWPVDRHGQWPVLIAGARAFARRWDRTARKCGWTSLQLYGLHRRAPWANLAGMGAAFLVAGSGRPAPFLVELAGGPATSVDKDAVVLVTPTGSRLRIYRRPPDPEALLAWQLA